MSVKRIMKEWCHSILEPMEGISAGPFGEDCYQWEAVIFGPINTSFEGGIFRLKITFPRDYPFKPPKVVFVTKMYHPNIDGYGQINIDVLRDSWTPGLTIIKVLLAIRLMLDDPNPDDPLVAEIAIVLKRDRSKYEATVKEYTRLYAK
ncbi:ubiquitin-conjugating enzyme E2-16 kDa-like [Gigantopelta aegis]|uniref:ubiquitin-conjugating enzyme E2-16 kDa-like n=1 Tax=Gigantopelta aegis TaxID=1735272 RepID=UPI001B88E021|nr:ubiquitin-conjugating enzyme E2-16 kDa-like [Gigantopelta aegis]